MLPQLFGKDTIVGIDIGSTSIKAVQIEACGNDWRLENAAIQAMPDEACRDGIITDIPNVAHAIKTLLRSANIRCSGAVAAITGPQVIVRQVSLPRMPESALRKSIRFEAGKYVSASIDDSVVEFDIIGDAETSGQMNVMLVAAPKDLVDSRVAALEAAGIEPLAIDVEALAIIRSIVESSSTGQFDGKTAAILDIGASHTDVNIVSNGKFVLTRSIPIAGASFTNSIKAISGVSFDEAERLKFEMTSPAPIGELTSHETESRCWRVVQPLLDELLREIRRSIDYYQTQFQEGAEQPTVSEVYLTGGTAKMPGMAEYVESKLHIPAQHGDIFAGTMLSTGDFPAEFISEYSPVMVVAAGLALKEEFAETKSAQAA